MKACQSECASPGGGEITEERRGAAGCQSKDLYRAVAAAETDIGRHRMHDKSRWTGGTRLKKQERAESRAEAGRRQSGILLLGDFCINAHKRDLTLGKRRVNYAVFILKECVSLTTEPPVP